VVPVRQVRTAQRPTDVIVRNMGQIPVRGTWHWFLAMIVNGTKEWPGAGLPGHWITVRTRSARNCRV
jgi:hypothetical protein